MKNQTKIKAIVFSLLIGLLFFSCATPTNDEIKFKISYSTTIGTAPKDVELVSGSSLEEKHLPTLETEGYTFIGWYNGEAKVDVGQKITADLNLTAKWEQVTVEAVTFTPNDVEVKKGTKVTLASKTKGAVIYYTLNGEEPTTNSTKYTNPIVIDNDVTIKAIATKENYLPSKVVSTAYKLKLLVIDSLTSEKNRYFYGDTVNVTIKGDNLDLLNDKEDSTNKVQLYTRDVKEYGGNTDEAVGEAIVWNVDNAKNSASGTLQIPTVIENPRDSRYNGYEELFIKAYVNGKEYEKELKLFVSVKPVLASIPSTDSELNYQLDDVDGKKVNINFFGIGFDKVDKVQAQLLKKGTTEVVGEPINVDITNASYENKNYNVAIPVPKQIGEYEVKILINDELQNQYFYENEYSNIPSMTISVLASVELTSLRIPRAGVTCAGKDIDFVIKGKNFTAKDTFEVKINDGPLAQPATFEYFNPTTVKVTMKIPSTAGSYTIKVLNNNKEITGNLEVQDYSLYQVGNIILKDGSVVSIDKFTNNEMAIIGGINNYGVPLAISFEASNSSLMWTPKSSTSYKKIIPLVCGDAQIINGELEATGDLWGKDNWDDIQEFDIDGAKNAAENYPAYNYVNNFASENQLTGKYATEWFIPSISELFNIVKNKDQLEPIYEQIRKKTNHFYSSPFTSHLWSSTQVNDRFSISTITLMTSENSLFKSAKEWSNDVLPVHEVF